MDPDPPLLSFLPFTLLFFISFIGSLGAITLLILLILCSAAISGSEVAYFSFSPKEEQRLGEDASKASDRIQKLRSNPEKLLATILVVNNLVNIAIVIVSDGLIRKWIGGEGFDRMAQGILNLVGDQWLSLSNLSHSLSFIISVVVVTFVLVLFGEIAPKLYANLRNVEFAKAMSLPLIGLTTFFSPISNVLVGWSNRIEKSVGSEKWGSATKGNKENLDMAIELASQQIDESPEQVDMLKGILKFGDVAAKQIMKPRGDVIAINFETNFKELMEVIKEEGYSRLPVYKEDFDQLQGVLYVKDLLGHSKEEDDFEWQELIRSQILYVPESKKIDDLLREFQLKRTHMGIVVDEYGGASGIITLEDIMEEVIGDIKDEFDDEEDVEYIKINDNNYIFEGKTLINDFCRIVDESTDVFESGKGDADSLAGVILEVTGFIPRRDKEIVYKHFTFKVVSVSKRRIEKINVMINRNEK